MEDPKKTEEVLKEEQDTVGDAATFDVGQYIKGYGDSILNYGKKQDEYFQDKEDYLVQQLDQQKAQAEQSYTQEQSAAYTDYQKQVDPYGVQSEQMAASGLSNSGYAESLKTQAYVAYQNRMAINRQLYQESVVAFTNAFTEAKMQNDVQRATLAYQTLQSQLEFIMSTAVSDNTQYTGYDESSKWASAASGATTRNKALDILTSYGISQKPKSRAQWRENKEGYDSYQNYLKAFVSNALMNPFRVRQQNCSWQCKRVRCRWHPYGTATTRCLSCYATRLPKR